MDIVEIQISDIIPYEHNAKIHSEEQIRKIAASIEKFKWQQPIVIDRNNVIVCGHGRYEAAKLLGYNKVPCKYADELTEDEIKAYRLADNRIAEADIDLTIEFDELQTIDMDMSDFDFDTFSIADFDDVDGYDKETDKDHFVATFTFPIKQRKQIEQYLRKHKAEITEEIMRKAVTQR